MPRTTLALKFGLYLPPIMGPLFLALSFASDGLKLSRSAGPAGQLDVSPGLLLPSILIMSYLVFGLPAFLTGLLAAVFGPSIERWEAYQAACAGVGGAFSGVSYLIFVRLMAAQTPHDRVLVWVAVIAGGLAAAIGARWTRPEYEEAAKHLTETEA